jgi:hypothetical protein
MNILTSRLFSAKEDFVKKHRKPIVLTLEKNTKVLNMSGTSNRLPDGDFGNSWTQYWMVFSNDSLRCSQCGKLLWNKENKTSVEACEKWIRQHEINNHVEGKDEKESLNDYESQGGHVELDGIRYITPLCSQHNTDNIGKEIVLEADSVLVEEVDPRIIEEN